MPKGKTQLAKYKATTKEEIKERLRLRKVLVEIATLGDGIKDTAIDWSNIGKMARNKAQEAIKARCSTCGK